MSDRALLLGLVVATVLIVLSALLGTVLARLASPTLDAATLVPAIALVVLPFALVATIAAASRSEQ